MQHLHVVLYFPKARCIHHSFLLYPYIATYFYVYDSIHVYLSYLHLYSCLSRIGVGDSQILELHIQGLVRFLAVYRIKSHAPPLVSDLCQFLWISTLRP